MIFRQPFDEILGQRSKVRLLRFLVTVAGDHSGRELAKRIGVDGRTCHSILRDLEEQGLVRRRRAGSAYLFEFNRDHILVQEVLIPAFELESKLLERYARDVQERLGMPLVSLVLFGSTSRGEEAKSSDVDLLAVMRDKQSAAAAQTQAEEAGLELTRRYGNVPQVLAIDQTSLRRRWKKRDAFIREVVRTGKVVSGRPLTEIL